MSGGRVVTVETPLILLDNGVRVVAVDPKGPKGDTGPPGPGGITAINLNSFEWEGVTYGMQPGVVADQTDVLLAAFEKGIAEENYSLYSPGGDPYWFAWLSRPDQTRQLPDGFTLFGDGIGRTIWAALPATFEDAVPEYDPVAGLSIGSILHYGSGCFIHDITFDGRCDDIDALGLVNRVGDCLDTTYFPTTTGYIENTTFERVEFTGAFCNQIVATVITSNLTASTPYQFTLSADHGVEQGDTILVLAHTGPAVFVRDSDGSTWNGNGQFYVSLVSGNDIQVVNVTDGSGITVTTAGSGGTVDNTTSRGLEGFGFNCGQGRNVHCIDCESHHNQGSGFSFSRRDRTQTTWGHDFSLTRCYAHHNGWQGTTFWGIQNGTVTNCVAESNDRMGFNDEFADNMSYSDCTGRNNGRHNYRTIGDSDSTRYENCHADNGGATDYAATYGGLPTPNDPAVVGATAYTAGSNYAVSAASWTRVGLNRVGSPRLVVYGAGVTSTPAIGKPDFRETSLMTGNQSNGSLSRVVFLTPQAADWNMPHDTATDKAPDVMGTVKLQALTEWPAMPTAQRHRLPPVSQWTVSGSATQAATAGTDWTGSLTSTAGTVTTIAWTAHGLVTGDRVLLRNFTGTGAGDLNLKTPHTITRVDANSFTVPVKTTSNGTGGSGIDYRKELAGVQSNAPITITLPHNAGHGYRYTLPWTRLRGKVGIRYKVIPSESWWTAVGTFTLGTVTTFTKTAHGFTSGDRIVFQNVTNVDDVNINNAEGFIVTVLDADNLTIKLTTTTTPSGGRYGKVDKLPIIDIGIRDAGAGATAGRFYPTVHQPFSIGDWYGWKEPVIRAEDRCRMSGTYQLAIQMQTPDSTIDDWKIVVDGIGDYESSIVQARGIYDVPDVVYGTAAYAGETLANNTTTAQYTISVPGVLPGDPVVAGLTSLAGTVVATDIIARCNAADVVRVFLRNIGGSSQVIPAGTFHVYALKYPR